MFHKRTNPKRAKINRLGIYISSAYLLLTLIFKVYTFQKFTKSLKNNEISYNRIETGPTPLNAILWYANVETDENYYIGYYSLFDKDDNIEFKKFKKNTKLRNQLKGFNNFKRMNKFSKDWYLLTEERDTIYYNNVRFGTFGFEKEDINFVFNQRVEFLENDIQFQSRKREIKRNNNSDSFIKIFFNKLFERINGK
jgi:inner membrane protein